MTYRQVLGLRGLGVAAAANASASASTAPPVSTECDKAGETFMKASTYVGFTSDAAKKVATQCCESFKKSQGSAEHRAKIMAECFARAAAAAGAGAACVAGVVTAPFAGVCATVGAFLADRVMGYNKTQLAAGTAASIVCGIASGGTAATTCFYVGAELVGWIGDKLGPAIEGIFNPGAANERELARRRADNALYNGSRDSVMDAEKAITEQWSASVRRLWDLFLEAFSPSYYAAARAQLGFGNDYHSIALAMINSGVPMTVLSSTEFGKIAATSAAACEIYGKSINGSYGSKSPLCPPLLVDKFYAATAKTGSSHDAAQVAKQAANELIATANMFFFQLPLVETMLASKIAVVAIAIKQQQAFDEARQAKRSNFATKAATAASTAEAAADAALKGNPEESRAAVERAKNRYDLALASYNMILDSFGSRATSGEAMVVAIACSKDADCQRAAKAVARAKAASELAVENAAAATTKRYLLGAGIVAAVAGGAYYFTRK